ncbi:MAG: serpin family protein [Streptosporangiaceae bacterium]
MVRFDTESGASRRSAPYSDGRLAMTLLLPDRGLASLEKLMRTNGPSALVEDTRPTRLTLGLPRFHVESGWDLIPVLRRLGVSDAFTTRADFSGISSASDLAVSSAVHRAVVTVDEVGTEAAAATGTGVSVVSAPRPPDLEVTADRPFLYTVTDTKRGAPLFLGRVTRPAAA